VPKEQRPNKRLKLAGGDRFSRAGRPVSGTVERHPEGYQVVLTVRTPKGLLVTTDTKGIGVLCPGRDELSFNSRCAGGRVARR
jgi:hypothetical protein